MSQHAQHAQYAQNPPHTPQVPQMPCGSDNELNMFSMLMNDNRYFGDINSQASPFAMSYTPHESSIPPAASLINMHNIMPVHQNLPFQGQIYRNGAAPVKSNVQQLTPNTSYTLPTAANTGFNIAQPTPNTRQHWTPAVRTRPAAQQFRFNPYGRGNLPVAAIPRTAVPQHTSYTTQTPPSAVPQRSNSQRLLSRASSTSRAVTTTRPLTPQLRTWDSSSSSGAHAVTASSQQPAPHTSHTPQLTLPSPHTPGRTDRASTGLLSPEKTPVTNNQTIGNKQNAFGGLIVSRDAFGNYTLSLRLEDNNSQPAAAETPQPRQMPAQITASNTTIPQPQQMPAQIIAPNTTMEQSSSDSLPKRSLEDTFRDKDAQVNKDNEKQWTHMTDFANVISERGCHDVVGHVADRYKIGKEYGIQDLGSEHYHAYGDQTNFLFCNITLTRVNITKNDPECILLTIYEWDIWPPHYTTVMNKSGPSPAYKSEILANKTDFPEAFLEFRKAFKKYTRVSWEARLAPQDYITASAKAWEKQKREQLMFDKVGEQREDGRSRSASPVSCEPGEKKNHTKGSRRSRTPYRRPEDVLTKEELASCTVWAFKYKPPPKGEPRGMMPELGQRYPVIGGDDPYDGGWLFVPPKE